MSSWEKWLHRPQSLWLRKALFQVHLWTGIGIGLYVLLMSVSGSALVYRRHLAKAFSQEPRIAAGPGARMTVDELKQAAKREYPGYESIRVYERKNPDQPVEIWLVRGEKRLQRLFNPYTGADLGDTLQPAFRFILWLADLHDNLLYDRTGRRWNAIGAVLTTLLCLTGAIIWWPGITHWRSSMTVGWKVNRKGFNLCGESRESTFVSRKRLTQSLIFSNLSVSRAKRLASETRLCSGSLDCTLADSPACPSKSFGPFLDSPPQRCSLRGR